MRQGSEIAARAERAAGWDHRVDAAVQEIQEARHEDPTDAGVAHRQRVGPEEDRRADLVATKRRALPNRMAPQQVELERPNVRVGDLDVREFAETRLDPVREGALRDDLLEGSTARVHALRRGRGQAHRFAVAGHRDHVIEGEGPAIDRTHGGPARHPGSAINVFAPDVSDKPYGPSRGACDVSCREDARRGPSRSPLELCAVRGRRLAGLHGGSRFAARISLPPPAPREGLRRPLPDLRGGEIAPTPCGIRLCRGRRRAPLPSPLPMDGEVGRRGQLRWEPWRDARPYPSPERRGPATPCRVRPGGLLPTRVEISPAARSARTRRHLEVGTRPKVYAGERSRRSRRQPTGPKTLSVSSGSGAVHANRL